MRLILFGCPGAGKGTQAMLITQAFHIPPISTGDIFRAAIKQGSALGKQVKSTVEEGQYVPDELVIALVKERIQQADCENGFLLDGFPRTVVQAKALDQLTPIDYVIDIDVPEEEVVKRLSGRRIHLASGRIYHLQSHPPRIANQDDLTGEPLIQRPDDREAIVRKRLQVYQDQTSPLRKYYQHSKQPYIKVDGTQSVDAIKHEIFSLLSSCEP